jgi:hypothetical protein
MHTAQLVCNQDSSVSSDIMPAPTVNEAKALALANYQKKYNDKPNWQNQWPTFAALLEVSTWRTT